MCVCVDLRFWTSANANILSLTFAILAIVSGTEGGSGRMGSVCMGNECGVLYMNDE